MFKTIKNHIESKDLFARELGITVGEADYDYGKVSMPLSEKLMNSVDRLHGGAIFTLADMAFGVAANYGREHAMITTSGSVSFMKAAKAGPITAEARLANGGRRVATYEVKIFDGEGTYIGCCVLVGYRLETPLVHTAQ